MNTLHISACNTRTLSQIDIQKKLSAGNNQETLQLIESQEIKRVLRGIQPWSFPTSLLFAFLVSSVHAALTNPTDPPWHSHTNIINGEVTNVWGLVSHTEGGTETEGVREQGAEENYLGLMGTR